MSTLRAFCWIGLISCMNWVRIKWFLFFWFARRVVESSPFSYLSITQFPISLSDSSSFSCVFIIWLCFGLSCLIWMPIFGRKFCPVMWAFQSSTMMNGPNWVVHPPDSNAMIRRLFGTTFFPFLQARFRLASADGSSLNTAEFCFGVVFLPFFFLAKLHRALQIYYCENICRFCFNFHYMAIKSSSCMFTEFSISKVSETP